MSLIDEALKRARQEASRQEAAEREARYARVPVYVPPARRSRSWFLPVVVTACLSVGAVVGGVLSRPPHGRVPPSVTSSALPEKNGTPVAVAQKPTREQVAVKPVVEKAPEPLPSSPAPPHVLPERGSRKAESSEPVAAPSRETAPPPPSFSSPIPEEPVIELSQPPPLATQSYVREVPVGGGGSLRLNGIAFSEKPVALFGDKVVALGESVGGFTVEQIEAKRVKLRGPEGNVVFVSLQ